MEQSWPLPPAATLAALVVVLVLAGAGTLALSTVSTEASATGTVPQKLVEPKPGENVFWPYTSRRRSPSGQTLAINVVVYADADSVRFHLSERSGARWNETEAQWQDVDPDEGEQSEVDAANQTVVEWAAARGAKRYLYVHNLALTEERPNSTTRRPFRAAPFTGGLPENTGGRWIDEQYQLHDGRYFGSRYHLRVYESPFESDEWVAIQAHSDHWDWFRLRHTVHDTENAQNYVEREFMRNPAVDTVWRMYLDNERGSRSDGWATVIDFRGGGTPFPDVGTAGFAALAGLVALGPVSGRRPLGRLRTSLARRSQSLLGRRESPFGRRESLLDHRESLLDHRESLLDHRESLPRRRVSSRRSGDQRAGGVLSRRRVLSMLHSWRRLNHRQALVLSRVLWYALLFASLFVLYLSVRFGGIFLEGQFETTSPKVIAAGLYPVIAFGLPIAAYTFGRGLEPVRCFAVGAVGIGTAIVVDYRFLGVTNIPLDVGLHRIGIAVALGLIAAGSVSHTESGETVDRTLGAGVLLWVFLLIGPLVGWL
ncbi:hypothetical protein [Halosimplex salinum]|uniref:hypothetical protein n=1 Tax=Halosimplex salinum TaxID=1710538 RepID=UPI000F4A21F6|nr:hypothetical protein [Halosimplex salinum]